MPENDDRLGLASLWDLEAANASLDETRELARAARARAHFGDAVRARAACGPVDATVTHRDRVIHVSRVGMDWVAGSLCSHTELTVIPFVSLDSVRQSRACGCEVEVAEIVEFVTFGAVLRRWERRSTIVTAVTARGGITGRIHGVWRDAVELRGPHGDVLIATRQLELVVESSENRA